LSQQAIIKPLTIRIKCPVCGEQTDISISPEDFQNALSGVVRVPIQHDRPVPHLIIVDVDKYGFIRGAYVYRRTIQPTQIPVGEIIDALGLERATYILYYFLRYDKLKITGKKELVDKARLLSYVLDEAEKIAESSNIINIDKIRKPKATIQPLRQILLQSLRLKTNSAKAEWIGGEYKKLKEGLRELEEIFETRPSWTLDMLLKLLEGSINRDELRLLLDIMEDKGYKVSKRIRDAEYKIKGLFG